MNREKITKQIKQFIELGITPDHLIINRDALVVSLDNYLDRFEIIKRNKASQYEFQLSDRDEYIFALISLFDSQKEELILDASRTKFFVEIRNEFIGQGFDFINNLLISMINTFLFDLKTENGKVWIGYENQFVKYIKARKFISWRALNVFILNIFVKKAELNDKPLDFLLTQKSIVDDMLQIKERWFDWVEPDIFRFDGNTYYSAVSEFDDTKKINLLAVKMNIDVTQVRTILKSASFFIYSHYLNDIVWNAITMNELKFRSDFVS